MSFASTITVPILNLVSHRSAYFYGYSTARIRATVVRFYMTTNTTQSAATPVHPEPRRASSEGRGYSQHYKDRLSNRFMYFPRWSATPAMGLAASSSF